MVFGAPSSARDPTSSRMGTAILCRGGADFGSLACVARLAGERVMVGCAHVMSKGGDGLPGSDPIVSRASGREFGKLSEVANALNFDPGGLNLLDAALARVTDPSLPTSIGGWGPPVRSAPYSYDHQQAFVCGATSGPCKGRIADRNWNGFITYRDGRRAYFVGLTKVEPACGAPGDSGAAVLNDQMELLGVNIASDGDAYSLFCPIDAIKLRWPELKIGNDP